MLACCIFETVPGLETISLNVLKIICKSENSLIVHIVLFNLFPKYVKSSEMEKKSSFNIINW